MLRALLAVSLAVTALVPAAAAAQSTPLPGAPGIGDTLFPSLGNGGYDVDHYALDLSYPSAQADGVFGEVEITARAAQPLSRLNLDFDGAAVASVLVDDEPAVWTRQEEELVVTPARPIRGGRRFDVRVAFVGRPTHVGSDGSVLAAQPDRAHEVLPSNDHPRDKATWRVRLTVPEGTTAVANGAFVRSRTAAGRTTWEYRHRYPMAPELLQLAVGAFDVTDVGRAEGIRLRHVTPRDATAQILPALAGTADHMRFMRERVGRYPFERYGILVSDAVFTLALETQTLSLFPRSWFSPFDPRSVEPIMVHELAHQWFGDSVSPDVWRDVWLNEGHATWYEYEYAASRGWVDLDEVMRGIHRRADSLKAAYGPVARPPAPGRDGFRDVFNPNVYDGGALVLYALRQEVGEETFRRIERAFVRRYRHGVAGTEDYIATASREAGRDLGPFLRIWLYGTRTPSVPGHPDWAVEGRAAAG